MTMQIVMYIEKCISPIAVISKTINHNNRADKSTKLINRIDFPNVNKSIKTSVFVDVVIT